MRTLKLRAFNTKLNQWLNRGSYLVAVQCFLCSDEGIEIEKPLEDVVFMQYTGLKDRNGKEIYEGDIVKIVQDERQVVANKPHHEGLYFGDIAEVKWNEVNLRYSLFPKGDFEETDMDYYGAWSDWNWLEVIGNIYENS